MEWLEEGTGRPEAALENKSKWTMCHLESCAVPMGESRFLSSTGCSAATVPLAPTAAQMHIIYTVLAVWDAVKYRSAGLHPYWTWASFVSFHIHHQQQFLFIYLCVCATIRLLYRKILKALLYLFPVCFPLLVNVSGINLWILALFKSTRVLSYDLVLSWCPECPVRMRAPLQPAPCKHNAEPSLKNLAVLVPEPVRLNHLGMYLRGARYRWAYYGENNTVVIVSSALLRRQICCWSAVVFWLLLSLTEIFFSQMWFFC